LKNNWWRRSEDAEQAATQAPEEVSGEYQVQNIALDDIIVNPYQPRKAFSRGELEELAESIKEMGVMQPVIVRERGNLFELVVGERRLRASRMAGLTTIPAIIRRLDDRETAVFALIENLQREDLDHFEEAEAFQLIIEEFGLTQEELARQMGKSQSTIANKLRLLKLETDIRETARAEGLSERHARALLRLPNQEEQRRLVNKFVREKMNVREAEEAVEQRLEALTIQGKSDEKGKVVRVIRDVRIFLNSFKQAVKTLKQMGIEAEMEQREDEEWITVEVRIPKNQVQK